MCTDRKTKAQLEKEIDDAAGHLGGLLQEHARRFSAKYCINLEAEDERLMDNGVKLTGILSIVHTSR